MMKKIQLASDKSNSIDWTNVVALVLVGLTASVTTAVMLKLSGII